MEIDEIKRISLANEVPIILDGTKDVLVKTLREYKPKRILEIGGGMGYSGYIIGETAKPQEFISIEKNEARFLVLREVMKEHSGKALWDDAYNAMAKLLDEGVEFDFIFLDGPKAQYGKYFNLIDKLLIPGGVIFADNINFHGMVNGVIPTTPGARSIVCGLKDFKTKLCERNYAVKTVNEDEIIIAAKRERE